MTLDSEARQSGGGVLFGGSPPRMLRLSPAGRIALADLCRNGVGSRAGGVLGRRLTDAGIAHPSPPIPDVPPEVTVVIPVRDRAPELDRALKGLALEGLGEQRVVVVDDGSLEAGPVAQACARRGAELYRVPTSAGPASARNIGWRSATTELVAFLDSDAIAEPGWIEVLAAHFADPVVGAVAPRITPVVPAPGAGRAAGRYAAARSALDLGPRAAIVRPGSPVAYVPTVALVARRAALVEVGGFDEQMRYGEDVDLVWRLTDAGWRVRYDPSVTVAHEEPERFGLLLRRRFRYGTSAAALSCRHPGRVPPIVVIPWAAAVVAGLLGRRPRSALVGVGMGAAVLGRRRRGMRVPAPWALGVRSVLDTWVALGRFLAQFALPAAVAGLAGVGPGPAGRRARRRLLIASLLAGAPGIEWLRRRPPLDPLRFSALYLADEAAYGAGVLQGCLRARQWAPLLPKVVLRLPWR